MRAYWFGDDTLSHGDDRSVAVGITHTVEPPIVPCERGLHASVHPADALEYATTATLWMVDLGGEILEHGGDKIAASERTYLARIDATELLRAHARWCASQVIDLWDAPDVVRQYLATGDESLRAAARAAAWAAAWAAARAAAGDAARAAAWAAAGDAARAAAGDAARDAARAAAGLLVRDLIGQHGFTQQHYDLLTQVWRTAIGPIHPDDAPIAGDPA